MKLCIVAIVVLVAQGCLTENQAEPQESKLEKLAQDVQNLSQRIGEQLGIADLDTKKIATSLNEGTSKLLEKLQFFLDKIKLETKAHGGDVAAAVKNVQEKLATAADNLRNAVGPKASRKLEEVKIEFDKAYKTAADQVQQLVKTYEPEIKGFQENIQSFSKNFLDCILVIGQDLQKDIQTAVEEHEKTHILTKTKSTS